MGDGDVVPVEAVLGGLQHRCEGFGPLEVAGGVVAAAHAVLVGDRGAVAVQDVGRGGLAVVPDLDFVAGAAGHGHGEVGGGAVGVGVGRAPGDGCPVAGGLQGGGADLGVYGVDERGDPAPGGGGLQGVDDRAHAGQTVTQVGHAKERRARRALTVASAPAPRSPVGAFGERDLSTSDYACTWADGIHLPSTPARGEVVRARADGRMR
jgi:hypothetical protein